MNALSRSTLAIALASLALASPGRSAPPNFIVLIADDISYDDLACTGSIDARTPQIDALAARGMNFTQAFLTASSCSPSRASLITGRYPHNLADAAQLHRPIPSHIPSIAGILRDHGYHTALAGKDHMRWDEAAHPLPAPSPPFVKKYPATAPGNSGGHGHWITALEESPADRPFFLWLAALDAHRGWDGDTEWDADAYGPMHDPATLTLPPALVDTPETRRDFASYLNEVTRFDHFVGQVASWVDQHGAPDNTWLFVLSDNGRPFPRAKTRLIDDGMKTYLIVAGPGIATPGSSSTALVSAIDLAPTLADLAGIAKPATFQGRSMVPTFGDPTANIRPYAFSEHNWHDYEALGRSVRDGRFLYIHNFRPQLALQGPADSCKSPSFAALRKARDSSATLAPAQADVFLAPRPEVELYDTAADPRQINNLAADPAHAEIASHLAAVLGNWRDQTGDTSPDHITPDMFDRETGAHLPNHSQDTYLPAPGTTTRADLINAPGLPEHTKD